MSSPTLQQALFATDGITQAVSNIDQNTKAYKIEVSLLSARSLLIVTSFGAALWYALWKLAINLMATN